MRFRSSKLSTTINLDALGLNVENIFNKKCFNHSPRLFHLFGFICTKSITPKHLSVTEQDSTFLVSDMAMGFMPKGFTQKIVLDEEKDKVVVTLTTKSKGDLLYREGGGFPINELITKPGKVNVYSLYNIKSRNREAHAYKVVNMSGHNVVLSLPDIDFSDPEIQASLGVVKSVSMLPANNRLYGKSWWFDIFRIGKSNEGILFTEVEK